MSYRAEPKGSMKAYLDQRSVEERIAEAAVITANYQRSVAWLEKYHARGRKTAFNWSPSITVTKTEETTSEEVHHEIHVESNGAQAAEVGTDESLGDAPGEEGDQGEPERIGGTGSVESGTVAGSRWQRENHTDFGDGDTPF